MDAGMGSATGRIRIQAEHLLEIVAYQVMMEMG
jgi:hypothetical protein